MSVKWPQERYSTSADKYCIYVTFYSLDVIWWIGEHFSYLWYKNILVFVIYKQVVSSTNDTDQIWQNWNIVEQMIFSIIGDRLVWVVR
jgi:hypothetical protein